MFQWVPLVSSTGIKMKRLLACLILFVLLTSCGGGGGSNSVSTFESPTYSATYSTAQLPSLYYEASPSGLTGTIAEGERFSFKNGDVVTFYISATNRFEVAKSPKLPAHLSDLNTQNVELERPLHSAYYSKPPVKGLIYENSPSGFKGVTDEKGRFQFFAGDAALFYIDPVNRIFIGKVSPVSEQVTIPPIANSFNPEVDASFVTIILYTFDKALAGSGYMDFSDLIFSSEVANKIKNILARKGAPNLISDTWQSLSALQAEVTGYTFRNSGGRLSKLDFNLSLFNSISEIDPLDLIIEDYLGVYFLSYGFTGDHVNFLPNGRLVVIRDDGTLVSGSYIKKLNKISYRWDHYSLMDCDYIINRRQMGEEWSLITIGESDTPNGCKHNINHNDVVKTAKIKETVNIEYISGKILRLPVKGVCAFGDGEAVFSISSSGSTFNQRSVEARSSVCTGNHLISGIVRESGIPGVLLFEFDDAIPRSKFYFSILQDSGRAITQISTGKTVLNTEFDFVYGAETSFTLD